MCYNCGCLIPDDDMGSPDNITNSTFDELAQKWKKPVDEVKASVLAMLENNNPTEEVEELFQKASKAWGQPILEAKEETTKLLKEQLKKK